MLRDNRQAAIAARIAQARGRFGSLARARSDGSWRGFAGGIAQIVRQMPLWKLQALRRFGALIQLLARSAWVQHIRANPRYAPAHLAHWVKRNRELGAELAARLSPAGFLDDQPAALQVARWAYRQAEAASAQLWVSLKYAVNADGRCLEILGG